MFGKKNNKDLIWVKKRIAKILESGEIFDDLYKLLYDVIERIDDGKPRRN